MVDHFRSAEKFLRQVESVVKSTDFSTPDASGNLQFASWNLALAQAHATLAQVQKVTGSVDRMVDNLSEVNHKEESN